MAAFQGLASLRNSDGDADLNQLPFWFLEEISRKEECRNTKNIMDDRRKLFQKSGFSCMIDSA